MTNIVRFENHEIEIINVNSIRYVRGAQIGHALELAGGGHAVGKIYKRKRREFTPEMSIMMELPTASGIQMTRLYSLRGAALIAMFSDTPKAAAFRALLLNLYEKYRADAAPPTTVPKWLPRPMVSHRRLLPHLAADARTILKCREAGLTAEQTARAADVSVHRVRKIVGALRSAGLLESGERRYGVH